jgi:hypothetical protein
MKRIQFGYRHHAFSASLAKEIDEFVRHAIKDARWIPIHFRAKA